MLVNVVATGFDRDRESYFFFFDIFGFSKNELCLLDEVTNAENIKADMKKVNNKAENWQKPDKY